MPNLRASVLGLVAISLLACSSTTRTRSAAIADAAPADGGLANLVGVLVQEAGVATASDALVLVGASLSDAVVRDREPSREPADAFPAADLAGLASQTSGADAGLTPGAGLTSDSGSVSPQHGGPDASSTSDSGGTIPPGGGPDAVRVKDLAGRSDLTDLAGHDGLAELAGHDDLADLASHDDLEDPARHDDLAEQSGHADVADLASHDDLADPVGHADVRDLSGRDAGVGRAEVNKADVNQPELPSPDLPVQPPVDARPPSGPCASEPLRTTGTVHYVCDCQGGAASNCVPGSDSNAGTSPTAPLQTFSKAASTFARMPAGDTVALCRGGRWTANGGGFANPNCKKDSTCDFRDYAPPWGDGSEPLPSISSSAGSSGSTLMSFTHVSQHQEGFRVLNLDLHGNLTDTAMFFWNETTDVDLCGLSMDGFKNSINMSGGDKPEFGTPANIVLRSSRITNNADIGYIAVCDNCAIEDSFFDNNGASTATTHSVYFASQDWTVNGTNVVHETTGMRLSRNEIHHSAVQCKGSPVVVHGRHKDVVIEYNLVDAVSSTDACWGPGVGCGAYGYGCWFRNTVIRGNTIKGLGNVGTESDNCTGCLIENNLVIIDRSGNGITVGGARPRATGDPGYTHSDGQLDDPSDRAVVRNNTIYFTATAASGKGISIPSGTGHTLENNVIAFMVSTAGTSDNLCYGLPSSPASAMTSVDYNLCQIPSNGHWASAPGASALTLAAWQALSGFDAHSRLADPMFSDSPADFTPAVGSPLLNAGDPVASPSTDMNGKARDSQPDIGAVER